MAISDQDFQLAVRTFVAQASRLPQTIEALPTANALLQVADLLVRHGESLGFDDLMLASLLAPGLDKIAGAFDRASVEPTAEYRGLLSTWRAYCEGEVLIKVEVQHTAETGR